MYLVNGTNSYEAGFLQAYLQENFDETLEVSNIYNRNTHKRLIQYLQFPEVLDTKTVIDKIKDFTIEITEYESTSTYTLEYLFTIENNINNIYLRSKDTYKKEIWLTAIGNALFSLKGIVYNYGWKLIYYINDDNRFISYLSPINLVDTMPRKELYPMINLAGLDYIDNYFIANKDYSQFFNEITSNPYIKTCGSSYGIYPSLIYNGDQDDEKGIYEQRTTKPYINSGIIQPFTNLLHRYFKTPEKEGDPGQKTYSISGIEESEYETYIMEGHVEKNRSLNVYCDSEETPLSDDKYGWDEEKDTVWVNTTGLAGKTLIFKYWYYEDEHYFGGFGDESEFFNNNSFRFKLSYYEESASSIQTTYYIDNNDTLHDMMTFITNLELTEMTTLLWGLYMFFEPKILNTTNLQLSRNFKNVVLQLTLAPSKNRLYIINNIEKGKYYAISHAYDTPSRIKYAFSNEEAYSKKIREGYLYSLIGNSDEFILNPGEVKIIKAPEDEEELESLFVQVDIPAKTKLGSTEVGTKILLRDINLDGTLSDDDLEVLIDNEMNLDKYSYPQRIALKSRKPTGSIVGKDPWKESLGIRTAEYNKITVITQEDIKSAYTRTETIIAGVDQKLATWNVTDLGVFSGQTQYASNIVPETGSVILQFYYKTSETQYTVWFTLRGLNIKEKGLINYTLTPEELADYKAKKEQYGSPSYVKINLYHCTQNIEEYQYTKVPQDIKSEYLYIGRASDYNVDKFTSYLLNMEEPRGEWNDTKEEELKTMVHDTFVNLKFNENPFLVHTKFMDYMLDSAIHKYSEEERIKQIYDLVDYTEAYSGFTDELKEEIFNIQDENNITFKTGYPDVETLYILKEGT